MKVFAKFMSILLIGLPLATIAGEKQSPTSIQGATTISAQKAKQLFDNGTLFIDVRKNKDWQAGRIPDALHLELKKVLNDSTLSEQVKKNQQFVFYCNGPKCMRSSKASAKAVAWGFKNVQYFRGGFPAWKAAGYPVE